MRLFGTTIDHMRDDFRRAEERVQRAQATLDRAREVLSAEVARARGVVVGDRVTDAYGKEHDVTRIEVMAPASDYPFVILHGLAIENGSAAQETQIPGPWSKVQ
jgi:hypothetical protein